MTQEQNIRSNQITKVQPKGTATIVLMVAVSMATVFLATPGRKADAALKLTVNTSGDAANTSRYGCDTNPFLAGDQCTLRAALQAANSGAGVDTIGFRIPSSDPGCDATGLCTINVLSPLPVISEGVSIIGPGATRLQVKGSGLRISTSDEVKISRISIAEADVGVWTSSNGTLTISESVVTKSSAYGIRLDSYGTVYVTDSTISDNLPYGVYCDYGTINLIRSTVMGSSTAVRSGVYSAVNIINSTLTRNGNPNGPVAYSIYSEGRLLITNSTAAYNVAPIRQAGPYRGVIRSSIIENSGNDALAGAFSSEGFNVVGLHDGGFIAAPTDLSGNGKLGPLQNNGGITYTFALQPGSIAIDNGNAFGLTTDQRGSPYVRTIDKPSIPNATGGDGTDSGAFEIQ